MAVGMYKYRVADCGVAEVIIRNPEFYNERYRVCAVCAFCHRGIRPGVAVRVFPDKGLTFNVHESCAAFIGDDEVLVRQISAKILAAVAAASRSVNRSKRAREAESEDAQNRARPPEQG